MEQQHRDLIARSGKGASRGADGSVRVPDDMVLGGITSPAGAGSEVRERPARARFSPSLRATPRAFRGTGRLDQVILDYLASEGSPEQIDLTFSPAPEFVSGKRINVRLRAELAPSRRPVAGASVQIRVLSSAKPVPVFAGMTGPDGSCEVTFLMPTIPTGTAAAVVRLTSAAGSTEIQYPVRRGV